MSSSQIEIEPLYYADKKHRFFTNFDEVFHRLQSSIYIRLIAFEAEHVLDFDENGSVPEMHDRIIVGLAWRLGVPLLTSDAKIVSAKAVAIVWE